MCHSIITHLFCVWRMVGNMLAGSAYRGRSVARQMAGEGSGGGVKSRVLCIMGRIYFSSGFLVCCKYFYLGEFRFLA